MDTVKELRFKIPFKNRLFGFSCSVFKEPNKSKLLEECREYFKKKYPQYNNRIEFKTSGSLRILHPELEATFYKWLEDGTKEDLVEIGKKYGIDHFGFPYWYYPK